MPSPNLIDHRDRLSDIWVREDQCSLLLLLAGLAVSRLRHPPGVGFLREALFLFLLADGACRDTRCFRVSNLHSLLPGLLAFFPPPDPLLPRIAFSAFWIGMLLLVRLLPPVRRQRAPGGADIKLLASLALCFPPAAFCRILAGACAGAAVFLLFLPENERKAAFPLVPFLAVSAVLRLRTVSF